MRRILTIALMFVLVASVALGQSKGKRRSGGMMGMSGGTAKTLMDCEIDWANAYLKGDTARLAEIEASDYTGTDPSGHVSNKAQDIADVKSGTFKAESFKLDDMKVTMVNATAAVVTGRSTIKGTYKGQDISGQYRFTDTWVKRQGRWQCIASQATPLAPQS